jgi:hypothetical protein
MFSDVLLSQNRNDYSVKYNFDIGRVKCLSPFLRHHIVWSLQKQYGDENKVMTKKYYEKI